MRPFLFCSAIFVLALTAQAVGRPPGGKVAPMPFALPVFPVNAGDAELVYAVKSGTLWESEEGERFVVLLSAEMTVAAHSGAGLIVPAAALSPATVWKPGVPLSRTKEREPRLEPLLAYLAKRTDIPRETSQLAVFALAANSNFADWQRFMAANPPAPATGELGTALDALVLLRTVAPVGNFALATDGALKLRALHDPLLRGKALQLYGLVVPGDASAGATPPRSQPTPPHEAGGQLPHLPNAGANAKAGGSPVSTQGHTRGMPEKGKRVTNPAGGSGDALAGVPRGRAAEVAVRRPVRRDP